MRYPTRRAVEHWNAAEVHHLHVIGDVLHHREGLASFRFKRHTIEGAHQGVALELVAGHFIVTGQVAGGKYDGHYANS